MHCASHAYWEDAQLALRITGRRSCLLAVTQDSDRQGLAVAAAATQ